MALFQTGSGYRDATKALTIKALQERQKQAQASMATAQAAPDVNADPLSAVGHVANVFSGALQSRRADSQESDARARLSQIMAGIDPEKGASMAQIAEMQQLDPDFANKEYERAMAERQANRDREDTQAFTAGESELTRQADITKQQAGFTHEDTSAATKVKTDEAAAISADERTDQNAIDADVLAKQNARLNAALSTTEAKRAAAVADGTMTAAEADAANQLDRDALQAQITKASVGTDFGKGAVKGSDLGMTGPDAEKYFNVDAVSHEVKPVDAGGGVDITNQVGGGKKLDETLDVEEGKIWTGHQKERNVAAGSQKDMTMLSELSKQAPQGPILGTLASLPILKNFSNAGVAFNSIVKRVAPTLRVEGSGSTSDIEYQGMLDSLPALENYPEANQLIIGMMQAKSQINIERGNIVDAYRNGQITDIEARQKLAEVNSRSISNPELEALFAKVGGTGGTDTGGGGGSDIDAMVEEANKPKVP